MNAEVSFPSAPGLSNSRARTLTVGPLDFCMMQSMPSWPRAVRLVPLSNTKVVPGLGQPNSMVWAEATAGRTASPKATESRRSMTGILDEISAQPQWIVACRAHQIFDQIPGRQGGVG